MKHIKQRKNECFLNTLAMLTDKPVDEILAAAQAISPYKQSWDGFTSEGSLGVDGDIALTYRGLARKYAPELLPHCSPVKLLDLQTPGFFNMLSEDYIDEVQEGRGAVLLAGLNPFGAHICAFEDGVIYDSALDGPMEAMDHFLLWISKGLIPFKVIRVKHD